MCETRTLGQITYYHKHDEQSDSTIPCPCRRWRWRRSDQRRKKRSWFNCLILGVGLVMGSIVLLSLCPIPTSVSASTILPARNNNDNPAFSSRLWHVMARKSQNNTNTSITQFNENGKLSNSFNGTRSRQRNSTGGNDPKKSSVTNRHNFNTSGRTYTFNFVEDMEEHDQTEGPISEELSDANFLKNFIDHDEDPLAQESGGPVPYFTAPTASGPDYQVAIGPTAAQPQGSDEEESKSPSAFISAPAPSTSGISAGDSQYDYENGNGEIPSGSKYVVIADADESSEHDNIHRHVRIPPKLLHNYYNPEEFNSYYYPNQDQHFGFGGSGNDEYGEYLQQLAPYGNQASGSQNLINTKVSMIDQITSFYSEHKVLALGGVLVIASLAVLAALLTAYANNLPTEVVLARNSGNSFLGRHHVLLDAFLDAVIKVADKYDGSGGSGCDWKKNCKERGKSRRRKGARRT